MSAPAAAPVPTWVFGASGVLAGELLRLLAGHPSLELAGAVSREAGVALRALHPHLPGDARTIAPEHATGAIARHIEASGGPAAVFLGLPHGESAPAWRALRAELGRRAGELVAVDLSADYRLRDADLHRAAYGAEPADPEGRADFVYGLPELGRESLRAARRAAAPGCFATALQLAAVPAAEAGLLDAGAPWVFHAVTGSSGSGARPSAQAHHPHRHGNLFAYALDGHRHEAELSQALAALGLAPRLAFVPHSGPFARGIHLTAALPLARRLATEEARAIYAGRFAGEAFVEVLAEGAPELRAVCGSNRAAIGLHARDGLLVVLVALDNLLKGGAGQALQCANLMLGLPEDAGLPVAGAGVC